jgi:hypothetical protein
MIEQEIKSRYLESEFLSIFKEVECNDPTEITYNLPLEKTLYKYINNVSDGSNFLTGGRENKAGNGLIQSTVGNLGTLASNIAGVATSFAEETKPYCMAAVVKCHIVAGNSSSQNYSGLSPLSLHFSLDDLESMKNTDFAGDLKPNVPPKKNILNTCISGNGFRSNGAGAAGLCNW